MQVLSEQDRTFWEENGYLVLERAVSAENLQAVIDAVWTFLGRSPDNPDDWYGDPLLSGGMVNMHHHQALWDNRQSPRVHQAFADIWGTEKLWVSYDRANMNPPYGPQWDNKGFIHWDLDSTVRPVPFKVQGVLYLSDTAEDQGGFQCVPGFHRRLEAWAATQPDDRPPAWPDTTGMQVKSIAGKAGDLVIWHSALPHGNGMNTSQRPRMAQYITMHPEDLRGTLKGWQPGSEADRAGRVRGWQEAPYQLALAQALGVPEGFVEQWLRRTRANDRVRVNVEAPLERYQGRPIYRTRLNGQVRYLRIDSVKPIDEQTIEAQRTYAMAEALPIASAVEGRMEQAIRQIPAPHFAARLTAAQLAALPDLVAQGPQAFGLGNYLWDAKGIIQLLENKFGFHYDLQPARLTALGKKLVGAEHW